MPILTVEEIQAIDNQLTNTPPTITNGENGDNGTLAIHEPIFTKQVWKCEQPDNSDLANFCMETNDKNGVLYARSSLRPANDTLVDIQREHEKQQIAVKVKSLYDSNRLYEQQYGQAMNVSCDAVEKVEKEAQKKIMELVALVRKLQQNNQTTIAQHETTVEQLNTAHAAEIQQLNAEHEANIVAFTTQNQKLETDKIALQKKCDAMENEIDVLQFRLNKLKHGNEEPRKPSKQFVIRSNGKGKSDSVNSKSSSPSTVGVPPNSENVIDDTDIEATLALIQQGFNM